MLHLVVNELGEEIDLEIGPGDDDPTFAILGMIRSGMIRSGTTHTSGHMLM